MTGVTYVSGDATVPQGEGNKIIVHVCNDVGGWGRGFVNAVSRRWAKPEREYRRWYAECIADGDFDLGATQMVKVEPDVWVANMVAQHGIGPAQGVPPIRYAALAQCLDFVAGYATGLYASVHMPRIGSGLAGGSWDRIEPIIVERLVERQVPTTVYDLA